MHEYVVECGGSVSYLRCCKLWQQGSSLYYLSEACANTQLLTLQHALKNEVESGHQQSFSSLDIFYSVGTELSMKQIFVSFSRIATHSFVYNMEEVI